MSVPISSDSIFNKLEQDRKQGALKQRVTQASIRYESSKTQPGLLDRIETDGSRQTGQFRDGEFIALA